MVHSKDQAWLDAMGRRRLSNSTWTEPTWKDRRDATDFSELKDFEK